jgi:two-component system, NarL family, response regulator DesR
LNTPRDSAPKASGAIRIVIAEDQAMVLGALVALLERDGDVQVIAQVRDGHEALHAVAEHAPDIVVTDIEMPRMSGLELAQALKGTATKVVVVTTFARPGYLQRALEAGVMGYLLKDSPARGLADAIRQVHGGGRVIDSDLAAEAMAESDPLTERERQVLRLARDGLANEAIALRLGISHGTVRNHLSEAIGKLGVNNRFAAAQLAVAKGWL